MKARTLFGMAVALVTATSAMAQSFNIDINAISGSPTNAYGAALGQAGQWNVINNATAAFSQPLVNLAGGATAASWTNGTGNALFSFNNAGTLGDDQALMDDGFDLGGVGQADNFTVSGLTAGTYNVVVYAWAPDSALFITSVSVNGAPTQNVGGAWPGSQQQGITYAQFNNVNVTGTVTINTGTVTSFSTLNGVQLQLVPGPGGLALLGLAGLVGARRRRNN